MYACLHACMYEYLRLEQLEMKSDIRQRNRNGASYVI